MNISLPVVVFLIFSFFISSATAEENIIEIITNNIVKVCNKPDEAGSYWDIRVKGGGEAAIKLKLAKLGITGEAEFSKGEWDGIKSTVEDSKNYRDCVKSLSPTFIEKFTPLIQTKQNTKPQPKILGGIKWQEFGLGLDMTLNSCKKQGSTVTCKFSVKANDTDVTFYIYGSSAIYDQNGNKYDSNYVSVANFKAALKNSRAAVTSELVRGVDSNITIRFTDVHEDALTISKAMIVAHATGKGVNSGHTYAFRDIKISLK